MDGLRDLVVDGVCPFVPMFRLLLILEFTLLVLLGFSTVLAAGDPNVAVYLSLGIIVPTMVGIVGVIRFCGRQ